MSAPVHTPLRTELPYREDSASLFEVVSDSPWAVFLDSGRHHPGQSRYDIIAAQPYIRLITRGQMTEVHADGTALSRDDPDREALDVVNHVFGGGLSSRLFDEIRERRGLAYSVYSGVSSYTDAGAFTIYAGTQPPHAAEVMELIHEQLALLIKDGITDDELDIAKGYLTGAFELGLEDTGSRMARVASLLVTTGEVRPVGQQVARWDAVQQVDARRVIERILSMPLTVVALGPIDAATAPALRLGSAT